MEDFVTSCKQSAVKSMEQFFKVFSFVPDDRLDWSPCPTAKSAMRIAAHTAVTAGNFAQMIRDRKLPNGEEIPALVARTNAAMDRIATRAEMERVFRANTAEVVAALDTVTPEVAELSLDSSQGWFMPMTALMRLPTTHAVGHTYQIDYLQTCWDDQEVHF